MSSKPTNGGGGGVIGGPYAMADSGLKELNTMGLVSNDWSSRTKSPSLNTSVEGWLQNVPPMISNIPVLPAKSNNIELGGDNSWMTKPLNADPWTNKSSSQVPVDPWDPKTLSMEKSDDPWAPVNRNLLNSGVRINCN